MYFFDRKSIIIIFGLTLSRSWCNFSSISLEYSCFLC